MSEVTLPTCYPVSYRAGALRCRDCTLRKACFDAAARWATRPSLSEALADVEKNASVRGQNIVEVYRRLYEKHFDRRITIPATVRNTSIFKQVVKLCEEEHVDLRTWITAQMHGMKMWLESEEANPRRIGFMVNMLVGANARKRYNTYIRWATKRYGQAIESSFDSFTVEGQFRAGITGEDERLGAYICGLTIAGEKADLNEVIKEVAPTLDWYALFRAIPLSVKSCEDRAALARASVLVHQHGEEFLKETKVLVRLRAAAAVAERYIHGLPVLARLCARSLARARAQTSNLEDVPGILWRPNGRGD
ncbi:hypothetical protein LCGC14_1648670 [marine sediment metagenome]|uniref:Uncharacterized protein n=1 Tax=marine sediment metagenome TaxID=412755 RepID=A0A0F9KDD4_9ZZZZ